MVLFLSFYSTRREDRLQKVLLNIPFQSMGIFPLILGEVKMMGLNSHLDTNYYVPMYNLVPLSLPRVDVRTRAHHLYTLRILWCISSTIHFTLITITNTLCTCPTLHIALWLSLLGFPLVYENLHDNSRWILNYYQLINKLLKE